MWRQKQHRWQEGGLHEQELVRGDGHGIHTLLCPPWAGPCLVIRGQEEKEGRSQRGKAEHQQLCSPERHCSMGRCKHTDMEGKVPLTLLVGGILPAKDALIS